MNTPGSLDHPVVNTPGSQLRNDNSTNIQQKSKSFLGMTKRDLVKFFDEKRRRSDTVPLKGQCHQIRMTLKWGSFKGLS